MKPHAYVCVAGTFDGLHAGHRALITRAFEEGERVMVGVMSDAYVIPHKGGGIRPFAARKSVLEAWLTENGWTDRADVTAVDDAFGPAATDPRLTAIAVSAETVAGAELVNARRRESGLPELSVLVEPMVEGQDRRPISARRIRSGIIDEYGRLVMPDSLRSELAQPLGTILSGSRIRETLAATTGPAIAVGDMTAKTVLEAGLTPALMIIDHKVNRRKYDELAPLLKERKIPVTRVQSGPGYISGEALRRIRAILDDPSRQPAVLEVDGEDDLLTLPAVLYAPRNATVYYGQPPVEVWGCGPTVHGIVAVAVTDSSRTHASELLRRFAGGDTP